MREKSLLQKNWKTRRETCVYLEHRHALTRVRLGALVYLKGGKRKRGNVGQGKGGQMRAAGQESKYCLVHPFAIPRGPFILKLTRPSVESLLLRLPCVAFACLAISA